MCRLEVPNSVYRGGEEEDKDEVDDDGLEGGDGGEVNNDRRGVNLLMMMIAHCSLVRQKEEFPTE